MNKLPWETFCKIYLNQEKIKKIRLIIAKIKWDVDWGKKFFCTLLPGPTPAKPPVAMAIFAFSTWCCYSVWLQFVVT